MIRGGTGVSSAGATPVAVAEAFAAAQGALAGARPAAALLVATPHHADGLASALRRLEDGMDGAPVAGALVEGVLAPGIDLERGPAVGLWLVAGVEACSVLVHDVASMTAGAGDEISLGIGRPLAPEDLLLLLPDAAGCDLKRLLAGVRDAAGGASIVGVAGADAGDGASRVIAGGELASGALAALWVRGARPPRVGVTSSCRSVAGPFTVTRSEGHWILALDGRPALEVYREAAREPLARDLRHAFSHLFAELPRARGVALPGDALVVRSLVGVAERRGAFALAETVARGRQLGFVLRDADGARAELRAMLDGLAMPPAAAGLYLDCRERGAALFGMPGIEAAYLERALPGVPVLGLRGSCQIGPVGCEPTLLTHAAVLALLPA